MKITNERLEIEGELIYWNEVKTLKLLNDKLALVLSSGQVIELDHLRPSAIDSAFRAYQQFLKEHPDKQKQK